MESLGQISPTRVDSPMESAPSAALESNIARDASGNPLLSICDSPSKAGTPSELGGGGGGGADGL
eukprot:6977924-Pyramimonas_sp.AAC.1